MPARRHRYTKRDLDAVVTHLGEDTKRGGGCTMAAACRAAGVSKNGIQDYMARHPEYAQRIERARGRAHCKAENAVFRAATTPDAQGRYNERAQKFWLTNQAPVEWKEKREDVADANGPQASSNMERLRQELSPEAREALRKVAADEILGKRTLH